MVIEKQALEYLGITEEDLKDIDTFKAKFDSTFVKQSNITEDLEPVKKILGRTFGHLETEVRKIAKANNLEVDFNSADLKDAKVTDKFKYVFDKFSETKTEYIKDLESKATQGNDEKVKEWEKKYEKINQKYKDVEGLLNSTKTEYEQAQQKWSSEIKNTKLNVLTKDAFSKLKLKSDISEFEKKGYYSTINEKYQFDLDETESLIVKTKAGERIKSTKVTGAFKTLEEILEEEAIVGKLLALNNDGGNKKTPISFGAPQQSSNEAPQRKIAKRIG